MKAAFLKHLGFFWTAGGAEGASFGWKEGVESRAVMQHVVCLLNWIWVSTGCLGNSPGLGPGSHGRGDFILS